MSLHECKMVVQQWELILWIYAYAIYIQEPNSLSVMNVTTWALHCIVLCQSFPLFNKYWRTQIPFIFQESAFSSAINFAIFPHILQLFQWDFWTLATQKGTQKVLCKFFSWKLICLRRCKRGLFYLKSLFSNEIKTAWSFVVRRKRKHKCFFFYLWMKFGNRGVIFSAFLFILA